MSKDEPEISRFMNPGGGSAILNEQLLYEAADKLMDITSCIVDDKECVIEAAEAMRQAYNRGILVALDLLGRMGPDRELEKALLDAMVPG
jgi:hypothetical protein